MKLERSVVSFDPKMNFQKQVFYFNGNCICGQNRGKQFTQETFQDSRTELNNLFDNIKVRGQLKFK